LLIVVGIATAWNLEGWPGRVDDDEGTYVAQAWAILYQHTLTHYSYWYDHPPLGWMQIAAFAWITDGFNRVASAVYVGREFMWCLTLVGCVLVYALCRRLGMRQATSAVAVLLFGLSPLAQYFHRMVSLDNIETIWVLAALVAATSTRAGWGPALRTGLCTAFAVLSKETALIFIPVIVWVLWQHMVTPAAAVATAADSDAGPGDSADIGAAAPAEAATAEAAGTTDTAGSWGVGTSVGAGAWAVEATPAGSASPVPAGAVPAGAVPASAGSAAVDPEAPVWMPDFSGQWQIWAAERKERAARRRAGLPAQPRERRASTAGPLSRTAQLRVFAVAFGVILVLYPLYALQRGQLGLLWSTLSWQFLHRPGSGSLLNSSSGTYGTVHAWVSTDPWLLIGGFVAALLTLFSARLRPFGCALLLEVVVLIHGGYLPFFYVTAVIPFAAVSIAGTADALWSKANLPWLLRGRYAPYLGRVVAALAALLFVGYVLPQWVSYLHQNSSTDGNVAYLQAAAWAEHNIPKGDVVVVDDYLWVDLKTHGLDPLWMWKITPQTAPNWKTINYLLIQPQSAGTLAGMPSLQGAYAHSVLVKTFGDGLTARRVVDAG
jgi:hypothetical protein